MIKIICLLKLSVFVILLNTLVGTSTAHAQEDLGLCPDGYDQGTVRTESVDCYRSTSARSDRADAELLRLQREAVCLATPNAEVTSSLILTNSSGNFFAEIVCTVGRPIPADTILCPDDSEEVVRAFDTLVCKYFGSSVLTMADGVDVIAAQTTECTTDFTGRVLMSGINEETFEDVTFFTTFLSCAREIPATDIIECPYTFFENSRDENTILCSAGQSGFETIEEAEEANAAVQEICTGTTAGLGSVTNFVTASSSDTFTSFVECEISIAKYGPFADSEILRACDASCTTEIEQARACLNGGTIGSVGCTEPSTQVVVEKCNTGPDRDGLCPAMNNPATNIIPLIILDEDEG